MHMILYDNCAIEYWLVHSVARLACSWPVKFILIIVKFAKDVYMSDQIK